MVAVAVFGLVAGVGILGLVWGLRRPSPSVGRLLVERQRTARSGPPGLAEVGAPVVMAWKTSQWWRSESSRSLVCDLAVTSMPPDLFVGRMVAGTGAVLLLPPSMWIVLSALGVVLPVVPFAVAMGVGVAAVPSGMVLALRRRAVDRRRHVRAVVTSFVDLVVMGLAGGVGVDGALLAAAQVSSDWAADRIATALLAARQQGATPWSALTRLGEELGLPELVELAAVVQLAGTEGTRIRQALTARSAAMRRHEQADSESAANAVTERLFLPGALLLVGFLVFVGYPAFHRIIGGFG